MTISFKKLKKFRSSFDNQSISMFTNRLDTFNGNVMVEFTPVTPQWLKK